MNYASFSTRRVTSSEFWADDQFRQELLRAMQSITGILFIIVYLQPFFIASLKYSLNDLYVYVAVKYDHERQGSQERTNEIKYLCSVHPQILRIFMNKQFISISKRCRIRICVNAFQTPYPICRLFSILCMKRIITAYLHFVLSQHPSALRSPKLICLIANRIKVHYYLLLF